MLLTSVEGQNSSARIASLSSSQGHAQVYETRNSRYRKAKVDAPEKLGKLWQAGDGSLLQQQTLALPRGNDANIGRQTRLSLDASKLDLCSAPPGCAECECSMALAKQHTSANPRKRFTRGTPSKLCSVLDSKVDRTRIQRHPVSTRAAGGSCLEQAMFQALLRGAAAAAGTTLGSGKKSISWC